MAAYLIVNIAAVTDAAAYADYRARVSEGLAAAGGRYLVRGGALDVLEGEWQPGRLVIVAFPSADAARAWWDSPGYAGLKALRARSTISQMVLVEGLPETERKEPNV
jgi:uncharacterized protein (DUF1330 family)